MVTKAKRLEYGIRVDREGRIGVEGHDAAHFPAEWSAEHLVLAGLARCVLTSLAYHARRAEIWVAAAADATGAVTRRDDGSWGFVDIECVIEARLDPLPADLPDLLAQAERGCFVGASLQPRPSYVWHVNGDEVAAAEADR